jgi:two-component system NtrC family sensor kinase
MPIALMLAIYWGVNFSYDQLYMKVNTDLSVSHDIFGRIKRDYLNALGKTADSYTFRAKLADNDTEAIQKQIDHLEREYSFSYIQLIDVNGQLLHSLRQPTQINASRLSSALKTAQIGKPSVGVEIFSETDLNRFQLAEQVHLPLIETPRARATEKVIENRGMMIRALYPIVDTDKKVLAILDAGVL